MEEEKLKYDPIEDKLSLVNDLFAKHNIMERIVVIIFVITWAVSSILFLFPMTINGVFFIPPDSYYQILSGATLTVVAFQFFGINFLRMILDFLLKWKHN